MSSIWLPGLVVLVVAAAAGLLVSRRLGRRSASEDDRRLRVADLERRREELYARLRDLPEGDGGEPAALELAAARVLRRLDGAGGGGGSAAAPGGAPVPAPRPAPGGGGRRPGLVGSAAGAAAMAVIALLVYWAGRDAAPGERPAPAPRGAGGVQGLPPDHPEVSDQLPAETQQRLSALAARLESDPEDLMARKELALTQLSAGLWVESFQQAQEILRSRPEDPDGLFVQGVVRVLMGNNDDAIELLDRVLANYPDHLQALFYKGVALYQSGEGDRAVETWQAGLAAAGGSHPEFERVLGMAAEAALGLTPSAPRDAPAPAPPAAMAAEGYPVVVELAEGAVAAPGAVVFVLLRPEAGGPPVAVRRIEAPRFPLRLVLGAGDSMMGAELPASGRLGARLDGDGSATTRGPGDLGAEAPARRGEPVTLVLSPEG
ncbi:MAG: tetratricopeptide repeat protein [Thermoanaerobaculia bacterium]|nr:tetratricopeptide repeat protein [Thermoanaerobaculia bacterium]